MMAELSVQTSEVSNNINKVQSEVVWQMSMLDDAKSDMEEMEGLNCSTTPSVSLGSGLRPGEDAYPVIRHLNPAQLCNSPSSHWGVEPDLLPMLHAGDGSLHWACRDQAENAATLTPMAWMG
jgi:E3 ubiquitin-protein ligase HUWE1